MTKTKQRVCDRLSVKAKTAQALNIKREIKVTSKETNEQIVGDIITKWMSLEPKANELDYDALVSIAEQAIFEDMLDDNDWALKKINHSLSQMHKAKDTKKDDKQPLPSICVSKPASVETQEDLNKVIETHKGWISLTLDPKKSAYQGRANLSKCDLRKLNLKAADLRCADLRGANLEGMDLSGVNLSCSYLEDTNLRDTILHGVNFKSAKVKNTDLRGAQILGCNFNNIDKDSLILDASIVDKVFK